MNDLAKYSDQTFESIKHMNEDGTEYWLARELCRVLQYSDWRNFEYAIFKAMDACKTSGYDADDHFGNVTTFTNLGSGATRKISDYALSRYACYLIVMNGDPAKKMIAVGQTYFAVKTRQQELSESYNQLSEDRKRLAIRNEITAHNKSLVVAAQMAGIEDQREYAIFQNKGYQGLYGGLGAKDIHARKGLKKSQKILDHMGSTELAANLFRATQTDEKLRRENIKGKLAAYDTHYQVGKKLGRPSKNLVVQCQKICQHQKRALHKLKGNSRKQCWGPLMMKIRNFPTVVPQLSRASFVVYGAAMASDTYF